MAFAKGQRVQVSVKDKVHLAHVYKDGADGVSLLLDDWMLTKPVPARIVSPSDAPAPEGTPGHRIRKKGERIEFENDGQTVHATIVGGDLYKLKAIGDGGEMQYGVFARSVRDSTKVIPQPAPSVMDRWGVRNYKEIKGLSEETEAFTADITYDGKAVIKAKNGGHGGCNMYHGPQETLAKFHADAKAWFEEANIEHLREPEDEFVRWHALLRPYAVDAMEHLRKTEHLLTCAIYTPSGP